MAEEHPTVNQEDVAWLVSAATKEDSNIMYDLDKVRDLLTSLEKKREDRAKRQEGRDSHRDYAIDQRVLQLRCRGGQGQMYQMQVGGVLQSRMSGGIVEKEGGNAQARMQDLLRERSTHEGRE